MSSERSDGPEFKILVGVKRFGEREGIFFPYFQISVDFSAK